MTADISLVQGSFAATCADVGFPTPPTGVRAKILFRDRGGYLFVQTAVASPVGEIVEWLAPTGPRSVDFGINRVLRVTYADAPDAWTSTFAGVRVDMLRLRADGTATVDVTGTRGHLQSFDARLHDHGGRVEVQHVGPLARAPGLLTVAQEDALRGAVTAGYYLVPRPLNLHGLAARFGVTASSLSERLRRAEGRVLTHYVEVGMPQRARVVAGSSSSETRAAWDEGFDDMPTA